VRQDASPIKNQGTPMFANAAAHGRIFEAQCIGRLVQRRDNA
jgi:hypothetical protein